MGVGGGMEWQEVIPHSHTHRPFIIIQNLGMEGKEIARRTLE